MLIHDCNVELNISDTINECEESEIQVGLQKFPISTPNFFFVGPLYIF
jgi:hypothetical protein